MEGGVTPFSSGMAPSGSYILIVVSQPLTEEHKKIILQRLDKGLLSWDVSSTGCDLSGLEYALSANIKDSVTESDVLIQHSTESLGVEVLLSPTVRTLKQCVKNLLSTPTSHKQLIHAGYAFAGSGSWILENGTFSFEEFLEIFQQANVQSQKRCTINVHCAEEGNWSKTNFAKDVFSKCADVSINPTEKVNHVPGSEHLIKCLDSALITQTLDEMMKPSPLVGNIRFNRPTIYMFPAGQGDCALFGINGFNMLIDGGFHRKPCSWDFVRHLDRLDAVLVTRIGESNVCGMSTLMKRNALNNANPQIGYVFCNIAENKTSPLKDGSVGAKDDLIVSVVGEGHNFVQTLNDLKLKPHQCWRDSSIDPFVLYHKVGQGTLEMHVLSPPRDSKEMKQFLSEWNAYKETFSGVKSELKGVEKMIPLSHATSICAILVWRPEDPKDTITRILFPGSAPQNKILEGLEKLKVLNILNYPVVTKASLNIPSSKVISNKVEKSLSRTSVPNRNNTASPVLSVSSVASRNGDIGGHKKDVKELKKVTKDIKKDTKEIKKEVKKELKNEASKDVKKDSKAESATKKELVKKDSAKKETKDVKKVIKKESKDVKAVNDKKTEVKAAPKKESTAPVAKATAEVKKTVKKSTTPVKKDVGKPPLVPKAAESKKSISKVSEQKSTKEVTNKKTVEAKTVAKSKPKPTAASPKTSTTPKTKPVAVPKPGSKMTKAVAASSIVASAVAVTVAAVELNEKKEEVIEDVEPEISEKEVVVNGETKEVAAAEKSVEDVVSPLPPEVLSPTPSESVSLTPSDTLSSAPLETVSPTPPLPNEPISTEEKDVNEIKDLEQDMPYEQDKAAEEVEIQCTGNDDLKSENEVNDIEAEIAKHQATSDVMSTSFIAEKQFDDNEIEEHFEATHVKESESTPIKANAEEETFSEKDAADEKEIVEEKGIEEERHDLGEKDVVDEKDIAEEKDVVDEKDIVEEKDVDEKSPEERSLVENEEVVEDKDIEDKNIEEEKEIAEGKESSDEKESIVNKDIKETEDIEQEDSTDEKDSIKEKDVYEEKCSTQEKNFVDVKDHVEEKDVVEEDADDEGIGGKDDVLEKDVIEEKDIRENTDLKTSLYNNDYELSYQKTNNEIDDQLAGLTMDGSFCAGMMPSTEKDILPNDESYYAQTNKDNDNVSYDDYLQHSEHLKESVEEKFEKTFVSENESYLASENFESKTVENMATNDYSQAASATSSTMNEDVEAQKYQTSEFIPRDISKSDAGHNEQINIEMNETVDNDAAQNLDEYENKTHVQEHDENQETNFDRFSQLHSMEESFHQDAYECYGHPTNIDDLDMQETSVDEPEEIVRKESVVSITLNDENPEDHYSDNWRRKSGTESEDDVDIGKYMCKEQAADEEKLRVQRGTDSDEEDVVKSPTPHAVVDYEGQLDDVIATGEQSKETGGKEKEFTETNKESYTNEKEDFDEKDRDSAEDQDTDDGEMIRHPTPPEMRYSEEEMRDPIGQHYITNPNLKAPSSDITEQPLYEEAEDSESERSESPIIEQPVFGNAVQADFPELVTVSGGTTPSEPQSPKNNFDNKKIPTEAAVMEALSEHDISESSTHSPSCQDGSTAFDLQASERSVIEVPSLQNEEVPNIKSETKYDLPLDKSIPVESDTIEVVGDSGILENKTRDDKEDNQEDKKETPSDEEESSSEDENSESHSKDKSDAMGDKSDVERDDRSDIHNDDRSDHHYDGKSDIVNDDDDKSDIQEDEHLYTQHSKLVEHEMEEVIQKEVKDFKEEPKDSHDNVEQTHYENLGSYDNVLENVNETISHEFEQSAPKFEEEIGQNYYHELSKTSLENVQTVESSEHRSDIICETASDLPLNASSVDKENTISGDEAVGRHEDAESKNILDYESSFRSENYGSEFQYETPVDAFLNKRLSDYDSESTQSSHLNELEHSDKIDDREGSNSFQADEVHFENSKSNIDVHGFNTTNYENENEVAPVKSESEFSVDNISEFSQEIPSSLGNSDHISFERHEEESHKISPVNLPEDLNVHAENVSVTENKFSSEVTETHQYETLSHYEENMNASNEAYSESTFIQNVISTGDQGEMHQAPEKADMKDTDFEILTSHQIKPLTSSNAYNYSSDTANNIVSTISELENAYNKTDVMSESFSKNYYDEYGIEKSGDNFSNAGDFIQKSYPHPVENEQYLRSGAEFSEPAYELQTGVTSPHTEEEHTEIVTNNGFSSDINFNGDESNTSVDAQQFAFVNGKDQSSFSLPSSEITTELYKAEISHDESISTAPQQVEQDSSYLINSRFHSESPEDNTMRSDSSPDVPYPVDIPDKFSDIKNSMSIETCSDSYIHNTEDYGNNMNFSSTDGIPRSPQNHTLNANQNNAYAESSEDEGNSPVRRGNVSPYAYTNKAYTREEEDIDGNHIYKEETTEVMKQVEFDGNNLQTLSTNQVSSVMNYSQEFQDVQYAPGANYDFRLEEWGKPMGLPTPPDSSQKTLSKKSEKTSVKAKTAVDANGKVHSPSVSSKMSSPLKKPKPKTAKESSSSPVYVDLAYVPQHADPQYCDVEFFKKIRARYYVISSVNPSKEVLNALLEAKKTWNEDLSVTIIPTYETDTLGYWMAQNQNDLAEYSIDVSPSASRCTVNLQDHQTSCSAYRLEF